MYFLWINYLSVFSINLSPVTRLFIAFFVLMLISALSQEGKTFLASHLHQVCSYTDQLCLWEGYWFLSSLSLTSYVNFRLTPDLLLMFTSHPNYSLILGWSGLTQ